MASQIEHQGIVESIDGDCCVVRIVQTSACASCTARSLCSSAETKEKLITGRSAVDGIHVGDSVRIVGRTSVGLKAVLYAFVIPFLIVIVTLFSVSDLTHIGEAGAGMIALLALVPYYGAVYLLRNRLTKELIFSIYLI
ncbi:MAG: SoxR reducing system RseC family protein [Prevotellaceae bacterium]|jgi:sigma-E factor negative regulatory protein RseC|nr:SoxR reducing system RseC family protein [Prevotellaceae bacterium]